MTRKNNVASPVAPDVQRHKIVFHLTVEERENIKTAARAKGLTLAAYVRMTALVAARGEAAP